MVNKLQEPERIEIRAYYLNGERMISIFYNRYSDSFTSYEKNDYSVEEYFIGGIKHYIFDNLGKQVAVWSNSNIECAISGDVSKIEIEKMLDSIYEDGKND